MFHFLKASSPSPPDGPLFFFDTETTGLPRDWRAPLSRLSNWPRMVQIAWILCNSDGEEMDSACHIICPDGFVIPDDAARIHGITQERALEEGIPLDAVLNECLPIIASATSVIAHHLAFDSKILGAECLRRGREVPFEGKRMRCTMQESTEWCAIPSPRGYKHPNLTELHIRLFGRPFEGAHDASADVRACQASFLELRRRGVMV